MATSFAPLLLQAFDDYGTILAGGKIETFEAGTTTRLATYQDLGGSTPNTNPVILDSAGRATIRVTNGVAYKFVISDADDNVLHTMDNIIVGSASDADGFAYLVHVSGEGTPGAQGFIGGHIFDDSVTFPIDFEGAQAAVLTNPSGDYVVSIQKNGVEVGTVTFSAAGASTYATTGGATVSFSTGDKLLLRGPDSVGAAADFLFTIPGTLT